MRLAKTNFALLPSKCFSRLRTVVCTMKFLKSRTPACHFFFAYPPALHRPQPMPQTADPNATSSLTMSEVIKVDSRLVIVPVSVNDAERAIRFTD